MEAYARNWHDAEMRGAAKRHTTAADATATLIVLHHCAQEGAGAGGTGEGGGGTRVRSGYCYRGHDACLLRTKRFCFCLS